MLQTFLDIVRRTLEDGGASAPSLLSLRDPLIKIAAEQRELATAIYQAESYNYAPGAVILDSRGVNTERGWIVRLLGWDPSMTPEFELHTHPFSMLTVGVHGPGYRTRIFDCDPQQLARSKRGDHVSLSNPRFEGLPAGHMLYFPANNVCHLQLPPREYSVSMNIITWDAMHPQYFIDPDTSRLVRRRKFSRLVL